MFRIFKTFALAWSLIALTFSGSPAAANEVASEWAETQHTAVRLIAARDGLGADGSVRAGLQFKMQPGWKVYWRSPGDAGFPPHLEFSPENTATAGDLSWPVPYRFSVIGLETLGYENDVVFPFTLTAASPFQDARLAVRVRYLTCKDVCIPYDHNLEMTVPVGGGNPTDLQHTIERFESQVPMSPDAARFSFEDVWTEVSEKSVYLVAKATSDIPFKSPDIYLEGPREAGYGFGAPQTEIMDDGKSAVMRVAVSGFDAPLREKADEFTTTPFTFTLLDGARAAETTLTPKDVRPFAGTAIPAKVTYESQAALPLMLLFAFLGGLILNLMPCVLPVLSIKFLSVVKHGGSAPALVRTSFIASAAGIVTAFMMLAGALIALKSAGAGVGWGIQFQQPWFLIVMAFLVTLFACNLWGFFEVRLPQALTPSGRDDASGIGGHFLQGMFATLLATPCSAPFLGTAVGFALSRGATEIAMIFAVLGLGLAAPYLLVAAAPRLATVLPAPGPWMVKLRVVMGFALAATAVWLLSVIVGAAGLTAAVVTGVALAVVIGWLGFMMPTAPEMKRATPVLLAFVTVGALANAYVGDMNAPLDTETPGISKIAWQKFDPDTIPGLVANGKIVFVDVTADWCITCQVNKRLVLENGRLLELLNGPNVIPMQADWTRPSAQISDYLASFGRYGIPFNAVYAAKEPGGVPLPELLTEDIVLEGFRDAVPEQLVQSFK